MVQIVQLNKPLEFGRYIKHVVFLWKRESAAFSMAILVEILYISQKKNAHYSRNVSGKMLSPLYRCHIKLKRLELNLFCRAHIRSYGFRLKPIMEKIYVFIDRKAFASEYKCTQNLKILYIHIIRGTQDTGGIIVQVYNMNSK